MNRSFNSLEELKDYIKENFDLGELLRSHGKTHKSSTGFKLCCPLPGHREKTPSFHFNTTDNYYYCYGCNRGGDVFTWMEVMEGMGFIEALRELADRMNLPWPESAGQSKKPETKNERDDALKLLQRCTQFYHRVLVDGQSPLSKSAMSYLEERGITRKEIDELSLGWAPDSFGILASKLKGDEVKLAEQLRLTGVAAKTGNHYDFFQGRLMIPIQDHRGRVRGFSGRTLKEIDGQNPKYKNSPESFVFKKKEILYGLDRAIPLIRQESIVALVEGYFDQWALQRLEVPSVAVMGTALGKDHLKLLGRYTKNAVLLLDADQAGRQSTLRSIPIFLEEGWDVKVLTLDDAKDPDEWLDQGRLSKEQVIHALKRAPEALEWWTREIVVEGKREGLSRVQILKNLLPPWSMARLEAHRRVLADEVSRLLGLASKDVFDSMREIKREFPSDSKSRAPTEASDDGGFQRYPLRQSFKQSPIDRMASQLFEWSLKHWDKLAPSDIAGWNTFEELYESTYLHEFIKEIRWAGKHSYIEPSRIRQMASDKGADSVESKTVLRALVDNDLSAQEGDDTQKTWEELRGKFLELKTKEEINRLRGDLRLNLGNSEKTAQLLHTIHQLRMNLEKN